LLIIDNSELNVVVNVFAANFSRGVLDLECSDPAGSRLDSQTLDPLGSKLITANQTNHYWSLGGL